MGIEGPTTLGYLRTLVAGGGGRRCLRRRRRGCSTMRSSCWRGRSSGAGTSTRRSRCSSAPPSSSVLVITLVNGVLYRGFLAGASRVFQPQNSTTRDGVVPADSSPRGPAAQRHSRRGTPSGYQGRNFVATGPHADELTRLNGTPAKEPIRVYAGLQTADTDEAGWTSWSANSTAPAPSTASCSSSSPPPAPAGSIRWPRERSRRCTTATPRWSACSIRICRAGSRSSATGRSPIESGRMLIDAVHDRWSQLPPERAARSWCCTARASARMAGQGAFAWLPDIARMDFSAVLWVGPPHESSLWSGLVQRRDPGTPEVEPRYDNGRTVRFSQADDQRDIAEIAEARRGTAPGCCSCSTRRTRSSGGRRIWCSPGRIGWSNRRAPTARRRCGGTRSSRFWQVSADMTNAVRRARRARPQLRRLRARRLGRRHRPRRLDDRGHRARPRGDAAVPDAADPSTECRPAECGHWLLAAALVGWSGLVAPRLPPRWLVPVHAALGASARRVHRCAARAAPAALSARAAAGPSGGGRGVRSGGGVHGRARRAARRWPMRELPRPAVGWLLVRIPIGTVWSEEAAFRGALGTVAAQAFGPRWGRIVQAAAFGLSHVADARGAGESVIGTVARHRGGGLGVRLAVRPLGQPRRADARAPGDQRGGSGGGAWSSSIRPRDCPFRADEARCRCRRCRSR